MSDPKFNVIVQHQEGRSPASELDYQMMIVDGRWGDVNIPAELKDRLKTSKLIKVLKGSEIIDAAGNKTTLEQDQLIPTEIFLWGELGFFTRDFRLGNLDPADYREARHYTLIAADCLRLGMNRAFTVAMSRVATILELSQSKKGFLREMLGKKQTVEERREIMENPSIFTPKKNK